MCKSDATVSLITRCICGYLAHKPRILVTHQLQYLKEVDELIVLSEVRVKCISARTLFLVQIILGLQRSVKL